MEKGRILALAAIIFTALIWGLSFLSIKITVMVIPPMSLALARFIIASVVLVIIIKVVEPATRLARKDVPMMALAGIIGVTAYFYFENNGVKLTTASSASLIIATIPVLALMGEFWFFGVKLSLTKMLSVLISIVGVYLIVSVNQAHKSSLMGDLLMFGAALSWVVYSVVTRPLGKNYSQLAIVTYQTLFGTAALIPFSILEYGQWQPVSSLVILNVLFLGLFCSALGYYLYVYAMDNLGISTVSLFINLIPVVAVAGAYLILREPVATQQIVGGGIIILAVYLASGEDRIKTVPLRSYDEKL